jgi:hypothetical protein
MIGAAIDLLGGAARRATRVRGFASWNPQRETLKLLEQVRAILNEYVAGVERLAGLFHVGLIYVRAGMPVVRMSADRQWDPQWGPTVARKHIQQTVGNGAQRRDEDAP